MKTKIYQICYSSYSLGKVPEGFFTLDNTVIIRPDLLKCWPITNFLLINHLSIDVLMGFLRLNSIAKHRLINLVCKVFFILNFTDEGIKIIQHRLNNKPRKILKFKNINIVI